jgi:hypothetical protein
MVVTMVLEMDNALFIQLYIAAFFVLSKRRKNGRGGWKGVRDDCIIYAWREREKKQTEKNHRPHPPQPPPSS